MKKPLIDYSRLPKYEITFDEESNQGIRMVSLVEDPAIEIKGMLFSKEEIKDYEFKQIADKQIIVGPAMIPNLEILRKDKNGNPYLVIFSVDTIRKMVDKFNRDNSNRDINVDHGDTMVPGFIQGNWIIENTQYDKSKMYGFNNLPIGTWFIEMKIEDKEFWNSDVKEDGRYSFSIEGLMGEKIIQMCTQEFSDIYELIDTLTEEELYEIFSDRSPFKIVGGVKTHPNCKCEIDFDKWVIMPGACNICRDAQKQFNHLVAKGRSDEAFSLYEQHSGKKITKQS